MKQTILISFSNDIPMLTVIHQNIPSALDLWTLPFRRRNEVVNSTVNNLIAITTLTPHSPEGLNQLSVLKSEFPWLPVILIAKSPEPDEIITAFKLGVNDLLLLPIDSIKIMESIRQIKKGKQSIFSHLQSGWKNLRLSIWRSLTDHSISPSKQFLLKQPNSTMETVATAKILPTPILILDQGESSQRLSVNLMGKFEIRFNGRALKKIPAKKERSLLAYILFHHNKDLNKEALMEKFWSNSTPSSARNCLNVTIHKVRKSLQQFCGQEEVITYKDDCYAINPDLEIELDVTQFLFAWKKGRSLQQTNQEEMLNFYQQAVDLYRGDFMEDMLYEEWTESEREKIKEAYLFMLNALCHHNFHQQELDLTIQLAKRMLEKDNCLEEIHRLLMKCYLQQNKNDKAIRQYFKCKEVLKKELNVCPSEATRKLYQELKGELG